MVVKLVLSLLIIVGVGAASASATQALLTDTASLTANTFSTGSVNLLINVNKTGGSFGDTKTGFSQTLLPGETVTKFIRLKNEDSGVDLAIAAQAVNVTGAISPEDVNVTFTAVDSLDAPVGAPVTKTLAAWQTIGDLGDPDIASDATQRYTMDVEIDESVTSPGISVTFDFVFTGTQVVATP